MQKNRDSRQSSRVHRCKSTGNRDLIFKTPGEQDHPRSPLTGFYDLLICSLVVVRRKCEISTFSVLTYCICIQYCIHGTVYTVLCTQYCIHTLAAHQAPAQWSTRSRHMCPTYFGKCFLMPIERFWRTMSVTCVWTRSAHMAPAL